MLFRSKNQKAQTRYLQDASYIRLKNLQLGYTLPSAWTLTGAGAYTDLTVSDFQIAYLWPDCMFTGSYVIHGPEQAEKEIQFAFRAINEIPSAGARG